MFLVVGCHCLVSSALLAAGVLDEALLLELGDAALDSAQREARFGNNICRVAVWMFIYVGKNLLDFFLRRDGWLPFGLSTNLFCVSDF